MNNHAPEMRRIRRIHFIGIGGTGMCGIAELLLNQGYEITGSDLSENAAVKRLIAQGATVFLGHRAEHVSNADAVVVSSAIAKDNEELKAAQKLRLPIVPRAQMLAELMRFRYGIAIAGTHGKTTTTSLVSSILAQEGLDPTFVIGGRLNSAGSNARLGKGKYLVAEADESDASFLHLQPMIAVVTNIEEDHMETYNGDIEILENTFLEFVHRLPFYGLCVLCVDDPKVKKLMPRISRPIVTYGFTGGSDVQALNFIQKGTRSTFDVKRKGVDTLLNISLNLPGEHNALNALAAIAIATDLQISDEAICKALETFEGVARRFQQLGHYDFGEGKAFLIDDYGHHPREIDVTIRAARQSWPEKRIAMIFQPHRYSRTHDLFDDFVEVLGKVDLLVMLEVYSAGEKPIKGADSKALCKSLRHRGLPAPIYVSDPSALPEILASILCDGDVLIAQGAGSVSSIVSKLIESQS